jgi:DNA-binding GntR family transcriptional regulator
MATSARKTVPFPVARIARGTMQDQVYRQLCDLILDGHIVPGQSVTLQSLADGFGISVMPVREALQRLAAARALTVISGRSIGIPHLSTGLLLDLKHVRLEVEGMAAEWAAARIGAVQLARLAALVETMREAIRDGQPKDYLRANRAFHFAVYEAAGSDVLMDVIEPLWLRISPFFNLLHGSGNYIDALAQHAAVLAALTAGDAAGARAGIRADIEAAAATLLRLLPTEPPPGAATE